jgi:hypothetical protein
MYAFLAIAGIGLCLSPSALVEGAVWPPVGYFWSISLLVSSSGAFVGSLTDQWVGEFSFLPLLWTTLAFYGAVLLFKADGDWTVIAFGYLVLAFSSGLIARWQDVRDIKKAAEGTRDIEAEEG